MTHAPSPRPTVPAPAALPPLLPPLLAAAANTPVLLVACDFDGTLSDLAPTPDQARARPRSIDALNRLARTPDTAVAVVSGRPLRDLRSLVHADARVHLAGSHGRERTWRAEPSASSVERDHLRAVRDFADSVAAQTPGALVEDKPFGVAFHYRLAGPIGPAAAERLEHLVASSRASSMKARRGEMVVEFTADDAGKPETLAELRHLLGASAVVFIGDDEGDEQVIASLRAGDVGVRVAAGAAGAAGGGATVAALTLPSPAEVEQLLSDLADAREHWARARVLVPIDELAVLSDQRTLALLTQRGRVNWLCLPRVDSPALMSELLGTPDAGFFEVAPADAAPDERPERTYDGDSFVLRTRWRGLTVTDYLDASMGRAYQRAGRSDLLRVIEFDADQPRSARVVFAPRLDFGRVATRLVPRENGLEVESAPDPVVLVAPGVSWSIEPDGVHHRASAIVPPSTTPLVIELRWGVASTRAHVLPEPERRRQSIRFWTGWASSLRLPSVAPDLVRRSAVVIKALCHGPSGAIAAAGTTSLPEHLGGIRNWDYRYCWPRDAALAAAALVRLGNTGVAMKLIDWLLGVVDRSESPERLRPLYTVSGEMLGAEGEIAELPGYAASRPVRVGNAASSQVQLDVFGPIAELVALLARTGVPVSPDMWRLTRAMVSAVEARWREPDHGIWEIRGPKRHHVHSKAMCWLTVHSAMSVHEDVLGRASPSWAALRNEIRDDLLHNGYDDSLGAFTAAYNSKDLDAAALLVGLSGVLPPDDPRVVSTVAAIEHALFDANTVYRYRSDDGLPGLEGGFHLCTGWLIESLIMEGRLDRARELFDRLCKLVSPLGLLAEQHDPRHARALGNFPQAYSHLALINAAVRLSAAGARP